MSNSIIKLFQIDAFTSEIFKGNPACVMPLENWLPDDLLLKIAKETPEAKIFRLIIFRLKR